MVRRVFSRLSAAVTGATVAVVYVSLRFAHSALVKAFDQGGLESASVSGLTVFALEVTRPPVLTSILLGCLVVLGAGELVIGRGETRLFVHVWVLVLLALLLSVGLVGLLAPFDLPDVHTL